MTLKEAHEALDKEYEKSKIVKIGFEKACLPDDIRVAVALINVAETARADSGFFELSHKKGVIE